MTKTMMVSPTACFLILIRLELSPMIVKTRMTTVLEVEDLGKDDFRFSTSETLYWTGDADDDGDIETLQVKWDDDDDGKLQGYVEYQDDNGTIKPLTSSS